MLNLLQNPVAALGVGLSLPFIQYNTAKINIKVSETKYEEEIINFKQTLYKALGEVENALSANVQYQIRETYLELILNLAKKTKELNEFKYQVGESDIQPCLAAKENYLITKINVLENRLDKLKNLMILYQSLGG